MSLFPRNMPVGAAKRLSVAHAAKADPADEKRLRDACSAEQETAFSLLETRREGLGPDEAADRLKEYGPNVLSGEKRKGFVPEILGRFKDPLAIQLLVICVVSYAMGDLRAGTVVLGMIFISIFLAYFQERRSGNAADKLKLMIHASAVVQRSGKEVELPIAEIAPGDIVMLSAGSISPPTCASSRPRTSSSPRPPSPASPCPWRNSRRPIAAASGIFELKDACFQGSTVVSGTARGIAVNTGMRTFLGSVAADLAGAQGRSPTSTAA